MNDTPRKANDLSLDDYVAGVEACDRAVLGRAITLIESSRPDHQALAQRLLAALLPRTGGAHRVGLTGVPGAGKSTLIDAMGTRLTAAGLQVAVLAIDPSSQITGGSILGDKTRMAALSTDPAAFIRPSPSARTLGGVARKTRETILLCEAAGFDVVLVETVGVGQAEVDIVDAAHLSVVVAVPGLGDEVQAIKAGVLEIADVLCVNKADHPGVDALIGQLRALLSLSSDRPWTPPIVSTIATRGEGAGELLEAIESHREHLQSTGALAERERDRLRRQVIAIARAELMEGLLHGTGGEERLAHLLDAVAARRLDPHAAAAQWIAQGLRA